MLTPQEQLGAEEGPVLMFGPIPLALQKSLDLDKCSRPWLWKHSNPYLVTTLRYDRGHFLNYKGVSGSSGPADLELRIINSFYL